MTTQCFEDVSVCCRRSNLLANIRAAGGHFFLGEKMFIKIVKSNISDELDTDGQNRSSLYKFHRKKGRNIISAYFLAKRNLSFLREMAVNSYLECVLNETISFRECNGYKKPYYVESAGIGFELVNAYSESLENRSLFQRFEDRMMFLDSESDMK